MDREALIETAAKLPNVDPSAVAAYAQAREKMVADVNRIMGERPDVARLVGADNLPMMEDNHANHARFVEMILRYPDPAMLVDTVLWVFRAYISHGFSLAYWPAQLNAWVDAMKTHLSADAFEAVYPLYDWFIVRQPVFVALSEEQMASGPEPSHGT